MYVNCIFNDNWTCCSNCYSFKSKNCFFPDNGRNWSEREGIVSLFVHFLPCWIHFCEKEICPGLTQPSNIRPNATPANDNKNNDIGNKNNSLFTALFSIRSGGVIAKLQTGRPRNRSSTVSEGKGSPMLHSVQTSSGTHPVGIGYLSLGVERLKREARHSPLTLAFME